MASKLISQLLRRVGLKDTDMIPLETAERSNAHATAGDIAQYVLTKANLEERLAGLPTARDLEAMGQNIADAETQLRDLGNDVDTLGQAVGVIQAGQAQLVSATQLQKALDAKADATVVAALPGAVASLQQAVGTLSSSLDRKADTEAMQEAIGTRATVADIDAAVSASSQALAADIAVKADSAVVTSVASTAVDAANATAYILDFAGFADDTAALRDKYYRLATTPISGGIATASPYSEAEKAQNTVHFCAAGTSQYPFPTFWRFNFDSRTVEPAGVPYSSAPKKSLDPDTGLVIVTDVQMSKLPRTDIFYRCLADGALYYAHVTATTPEATADDPHPAPVLTSQPTLVKLGTPASDEEQTT